MLSCVLHKDFPLRARLLVTSTHWMVHEDLSRATYQAPWKYLTS
jgi:hypothetical protein